MTIDIAILIGVAIIALVGGYFAGTLQGDSAAYIDGYQEGKKEVCERVLARMQSDVDVLDYVERQLEELE
jgi:hypothetical protein